MELTMSIILEKLNSLDFTIIQIEESHCFTGVRLCLNEQLVIPGILPICIGATDKPGLLVQTFAQGISVLNGIQDVFDYYNQWNKEVTDKILNQSTIQEILNTAAMVLKNPLVVIDASFVVLFYAGTILGDIQGSVWDSVIHNGYFRVEEYSRALEQKIQESERLHDVFLYDPGYKNQEMHITAPLFYKGKHFAGLGSCDINCSFTPGQIDLFKMVRNLMEAAFAQNKIFQMSNEEDTYYIEQLIHGYKPENKPLAYYLHQKGWHIHDTYRVCVMVKKDPLDKREFSSRVYSFRLNKIMVDSIITSGDQMLVIILHNPQIQFAEEVYNQLNNFLNSENFICGVSSIFTDFRNLQYAYQQSLLTLKQSEDVKSNIRFFMDNYRNILIESLYDITDIKTFCHPRLLQLWKQKGEEARQVLDTIDAYLNCGGNINRTSEMLGIHRNTLQYRLDRMYLALDIELRNVSADQKFYLQFSCMILKFLMSKEEVKELV